MTNVAAFGAFVDIGVHQDGLVHVSAMSRNFVSDPRAVVKSGDVVRVKVLSVDMPPAAGSRSPCGWTTTRTAPGRPPQHEPRTVPRQAIGPNGPGFTEPVRAAPVRPPRSGRAPDGALADALRRRLVRATTAAAADNREYPRARGAAGSIG